MIEKTHIKDLIINNIFLFPNGFNFCFFSRKKLINNIGIALNSNIWKESKYKESVFTKKFAQLKHKTAKNINDIAFLVEFNILYYTLNIYLNITFFPRL